MKVGAFLAMSLLLSAVLSGCSAPSDELMWGANGSSWSVKQAIIPVGQAPAPPEEEGVRGAEPAIPDGFAEMDVDLPTFGLRWNEAAEMIPMPELVQSEITTIYQRSFLAFGFRLAGEDWHTVAGSVDYDSGRVLSADLEWAGWMTVQPDADSDAIPAAWLCMVYASSPNYSLDDAQDIVATLTETPGESAELVNDGVRYRFSESNGEGNLVITGAE